MHCTTRRGVVQGVGARRVGSVRRVLQCRTRCRGPTRRGCTTRRAVSYKVSYSTDTVRHLVRHSTTQYDTVRHSTTKYDTVRHSTTQYDTVRHGRHINTCIWKKKQIGQNGAKWVQMRFYFGQNTPKGENSNIGTSRLQTCRQCLQLAGRIYLWCTVSTDPRPPSPCVRVNDGSGPFLGEGGLRPPSQILALRVYNMPTVSTIRRLRLPVVHSVYRSQTALPLCAGKQW